MHTGDLILWSAAVAAAYVVGSIPFGVIIGRMRGLDIRQHGSRNVGATNVTRVLGKRLGLTCFLLDVAKGALPVLGAGLATGEVGKGVAEVEPHVMFLWLAVALAAILGHMYSVFIRFAGGKGVATGFGAMLGMYSLLTLPALIAIVVWYTTLRLTRYVSLASIAAAASLPLLVALSAVPRNVDSQPLGDSAAEVWRAWPLMLATALLAGLVVWKHRTNISRLRQGKEPRVGGSKRRGDFLDLKHERSGENT